MSITDGTVLRVVVSMVYTDGSLVQNIFNAVVTGAGAPWDEADIVDDCEDWADDMYLNLGARVTDTLDGVQVQVYEYDSIDDDWDEVGTNAWLYNPTGASAAMPRGNAGLINGKTTDPDVSGKKYIGGLTVNDIAAGLLTATMVTAITNFAIDWYTPFVGAAGGGTYTPGVWSVAGTVFKALSGTMIVSNVVAYQRRRKRGVGA